MSLTIKAQLASAMLSNMENWAPISDGVKDLELFLDLSIGSTDLNLTDLIKLRQKATAKIVAGFVDEIYEALLESEK
jgi:hypothetical protein